MDGEKPLTSIWYTRLVSNYPDLLERALTEKCQLLIPQTRSLTTKSIQRKDYEHHIVCAGKTRGEYNTLSGRKILIVGAQVIADEGFPHQVAAKLLFTDRIEVKTTLLSPPKTATSPQSIPQPRITRGSSAFSFESISSTIATSLSSMSSPVRDKRPTLPLTTAAEGGAAATTGLSSSIVPDGISREASGINIAASSSSSVLSPENEAASAAMADAAAREAGGGLSSAGALTKLDEVNTVSGGGGGGIASPLERESSASGTGLTALSSPILSPPETSTNSSSSSSSSNSSSSSALSPPPSASRVLEVYYISRPLDGGMAAPSGIDDMSHGDLLKMSAMFRSSLETEVIFSELSATVRQARKVLEESRAALKAAVTKGGSFSRETMEAALAPLLNGLHGACVEASEALLTTSFYADETKEEKAKAKRQLMQMTESIVTEQLHDTFFEIFVDCRDASVASMREVLLTLRSAPADFLDVKPVLQCNFFPAVATLGLLQSAVTPLEKLHCLRDTNLTARRCIERKLEQDGIDISSVDVGTDDMLPILCYLLVLGCKDHGTEQLGAHLDFIEWCRFSTRGDPPYASFSPLQMDFANFSAIFEYMETDGKSLASKLRERK